MELVNHPLDPTLAVRADADLLEAPRQLPVPVSYRCIAGRRGTCRCQALAGRVLKTGRPTRITHPHDDRRVPACMGVLTENCTTEIPEPREAVIRRRMLRAAPGFGPVKQRSSV
jgi:ferredoxin-NAD(P)+ reductase (naphthalene dioxygenase ferredoxin-specific)